MTQQEARLETIIDKLLGMEEGSPQLAIAQEHCRNLLDFAAWCNTLDPHDGIHLFADEVGFAVNEVRDAFSKVVRERIKEIDYDWE